MKNKILFLSILILMMVAFCNKSFSINFNNTSTKLLNFNVSKIDSIVKYPIDSLNYIDKNYTIEKLDNTNGLSNSSVNTIFQDSENLLWIGTWDGLNRYDGNKFKIFRPELNNENSLSNQVVLKIDEDNTGKIWILTMHGINRYDKKTDTFKRYYFSRENEPPLTESEFNMALDSSKTVYCAVKNWGIGYFDGLNFQLLNTKNLPSKVVKKMEFISTGELLILFDNNELYLLTLGKDTNGKKVISNYKILSNNTKTFGIFQNQKICIVLNSGNVKIHSLTENKDANINGKNIQNIIGNIPSGLILSDKSSYFILNDSGMILNPLWLKYLNNQKVTTLLKGSENIFWTGTDGDGILKLYPLRKSFKLISKVQVPEIDGGIIRSFLEIKDNSFFVGTKGKGLFRFQYKFYLNRNKPLKYKIFNDSNSTINNSVFAICEGNDKLVFLGTDGDGISVFDLKKSKVISWSEITGHNNCDYFKSAYSIYQDKNGFIWIGTNGYGMIRCKIERFKNGLKVTHFKKYNADVTKNGTISSNIIFSIIPRNNNELWIGTRLGGLNLFNIKKESFKTFKKVNNNPNSLSNNDILCLHIDNKERLWVGTSLGLNLLTSFKNEEHAIFRRFTVKDGLPNNTIHGIVSDKQSNLWVSTNFGLSNYIVDESKFINYTKNEGLQNNEFSDGAFYEDTNSSIVFMGGIKGFNYFMPKKIKESSYIPTILIDKISGQNQEIPYYQGLIVSPNSTTFPSIILNYNQNFFDVELSALTYINSEKCQFAYKLNNFDSNWNTINNRNIISFTNVPKGHYSLWLKWSNSDGIWTKPVHAIDIRVKPIFWQSNIAIILYFLLFFVLMLFIISYYKKQHSLQQNILIRKQEEETHQNRLTFFTNIAHEFQTPLTLIIGPIQKLSELTNIGENNQKFIKMVQRNSSRLLFLTQQLLEFRKAEYDYLEVTVKQFDLVNLVEQIAELFDEMSLQKNIEFKLEIPSELNGWFDKDKIEKIIFNLLSNAFKYTPNNGKIRLRIFIEGNITKKLNIAVINSGKGIPKEKMESLFNRFFLANEEQNSNPETFRTGIGLAYIKKLVTVLRGNIDVSSVENENTIFIVFLPCSKEAFTEKEIDQEVKQVFISHHLKNILEDVNVDSGITSNKVSSIESILNKQKVVLIVEDDKEIHVLLNELLKNQYTILSAHNGIEALEIIESKRPDIIISDVMMPLMDGIELCKRIKENHKTSNIPFIMLTAKDSVINRIEGLKSGANSYIPKPFHPDHLFVRIQKLLKEKEAIQNYLSQDLLVNIKNPLVNNEEKDFIKKVVELIHSNIENENLQSAFLEKKLGISSSQFYRTIKKFFDFSPGDLIRTIRLKHAAELLKKSDLTVSEICYQSGFNNRSYFYREFKKMYGNTPKNYQIKFNSKL